MNEDINALLQLNGTQKERDWLQENMETLSVRERTILAAVFQQPPCQYGRSYQPHADTG